MTATSKRIRWWTSQLHVSWRGGRVLHTPGDALSTLAGVFKSVHSDPAVRVAYHTQGRSLWTARYQKHSDLDLQLVLSAANETHVRHWLAALETHVSGPTSGLELLSPVGPPIVAEWTPEATDDTALIDELCLDFRTPFPFNRSDNRSRTMLDRDTLQITLNRRIDAWFGVADALGSAPSLQVVPAYWHYDEFRRTSKSQPPSEEAGGLNHYIRGCRGPLLLRNVPKQWIGWLKVLQTIHAAGPHALSGLGQFELTSPAPSFIDGKLAELSALEAVVEEVLRTHDTEPPINPSNGETWSPVEMAAQIRTSILDGSYLPQANQRFEIAKANGEPRAIERLSAIDLMVQRHLLLLVGPVVDAVLSPASFGFRKNRSREQALQRLRDAFQRGMRFAVRADIEDFFPSVQHERLIGLVDNILPAADILTRTLIRQAVRVAWLHPKTGETQERDHGLAQGAPLSPMLANLYLDYFDRKVEGLGFELVRYGDDFVVLARTRAAAETALRTVQELLAPQGLQLSAHKSAVVAVADGFEFLGERVGEHTDCDPVTALSAQRKPFIVTEPYISLGVNGDAIDVRRLGKIVATVPLRRVSELITLSPVTLSSMLLERCATHRIPLAIALPKGYQVACIAPDSRRFFEIAHAQATRYGRLSPSEKAAIAADFLAAKIDNYVSWIRSSYRAGDAAIIETLERMRDSGVACGETSAMRGYEGIAAKHCFAWLRERIREDQRTVFSAKRRERGAPDRLNSMLNLGYYLLFTRINALLRSHGLNPYLGYLHDSQDDYETLVADLMEVFRVHVDRTVLRLINRREVAAADFRDDEQRYRMQRAGALKLAGAFETTLNAHHEGTTIADVMLAEVRTVRDFAVEGRPLWLYRWGRRSGDADQLQPTEHLNGDGEDSGLV